MLEVTIPYLAAEEVDNDDDHTTPIHGGETKEEEGMASSEERPLDHVMGIAEQSHKSSVLPPHVVITFPGYPAPCSSMGPDVTIRVKNIHDNNN